MSASNILDVELCKGHDAPDDCKTIRDYLKALLRTLWQEQEGFKGKRPFGNSGWEFDLYIALVHAGLVSGTLDEEGDLLEVDSDAADELISTAIDQLQ